MGVFATRSPFRPNPIGLSCVKLEKIEYTGNEGPVLYVRGADLMDGTPIFDIKPYIPYADCHPEASGGFAPDSGRKLSVRFAPGTKERFPAEKLGGLRGVLENDPRPRYQKDPDRVYAMEFAGREIKFSVDADELTVKEIK